MTTESIPVYLSPDLYRRLERLATLMHRPLDDVLERALTTALPPLPEDVPAVLREALLDLERVSDAELRLIMESRLSDIQIDRRQALRERKREGVLNAEDQEELAQLEAAVDQQALRKAYAAVLLKWRGYHLPSLDDLNAAL